MESDIEKIRRARRQPVEPAETIPFGGNTGSASIPAKGNTSFNSSFKKRSSGKHPEKNVASVSTSVSKWADDALKNTAPRRVRALLAIRDAARIASRKGLDPSKDPIYVSDNIRKGWNLSPKDLSTGVSELRKRGLLILQEPRVKGKHARFTINPVGGNENSKDI